MEELSFNKTDIVVVGGIEKYFDVVEVIHNDKRLFVSNSLVNGGVPFFVPFNKIVKQFVLKEGFYGNN